jgi:hypothetical protein
MFLSGSNHIYPIAVIHTNCNHTYSECVNYMHLTNDWLIVVQYEQYSVFFNLYKSNTCLFRTQILVSMWFHLERFRCIPHIYICNSHNLYIDNSYIFYIYTLYVPHIFQSHTPHMHHLYLKYVNQMYHNYYENHFHFNHSVF